ncbi:MAG: cellulase family glycosylhydrolase [Halanaerobiales bacterium]
MKVIIKFLKFLLPALCLIFFCGDRAFAATLGDLNDDGYINSSDYTLLRRYLLNLSSDINSGVADLNGDRKVNSSDYILLRRYLLGMLDSFPGGGDRKGFYVQDGKLYDANGNEFIMRGINHAHTWFKDQLDTALTGIANTNANIVRIVLSNGGQWTKDDKNSLKEIIDKCKERQLIVMFEVHDCTGYGETQHAPNAVHISTAVDYWIEMKDVLMGEEAYVIINIANEPFGNNVSADTYVNDHITAIQRMRNAGFKHTLVVDGANWGQDWENIMRNRALEIFNADPERNVVFSVHMYQVYQNDYTINDYMRTFIDNRLPLIVGEFGADHQGQEVDEYSIMQRAEEYGIGYIGWSWKGNNPENANLDIALDWAGNTLSSWGESLINSTYGIKNTAETCTIFTQ